MCLEMAVENSPSQPPAPAGSVLWVLTERKSLLSCLRKDVSQLSGPFESGPRSSMSFTSCLLSRVSRDAAAQTAHWSCSFALYAWAGLVLLTAALQALLPGFTDETEASFLRRATWAEPIAERTFLLTPLGL